MISSLSALENASTGAVKYCFSRILQTNAAPSSEAIPIAPSKRLWSAADAAFSREHEREPDRSLLR